MGSKVLRCGEHGSGQAAKLANNLSLAIQMAAVSEGLSFGKRHGLDPKTLTSIFNSSSAHCWSSEKYNPVPVSVTSRKWDRFVLICTLEFTVLKRN